MRKLVLFAFLGVAFWVYASNYSPYVTRVFEYRPAPGQFVNKLPKYEQGDTPEIMAAKAQLALAANNRGLVSLGGFGGYIVLGFDHTIVNVPGSPDFRILGNAFWSTATPDADDARRGGSSEPGIVMVSVDVNQNGLPDDEWYELAGSEFYSPETIHAYEISYYRPDVNKTPTPDNVYKFLTDTTYIRWTTNGYGNGYVFKNSFHAQSYWPLWLEEDVLKFEGTKLANNYIDESGNGSYFVQYAYPWGYADNAPNDDPASAMNIEWAVDRLGNAVHLDGIDFIKIYTGVNQYCGWLGESSTEVMGVVDLHPDVQLSTSRESVALVPDEVVLLSSVVNTEMLVMATQAQTVEVVSVSGASVKQVQLGVGANTINCSALSRGVYFLKTKDSISKFIKY